MIDTLLAALAMASVVSVGLLFLPAIIELKKPRDSGPRLIPDSMAQTQLITAKTAVFNLEDDLKNDNLSVALTENLCSPSNLEN